jgi:hypothetical protein
MPNATGNITYDIAAMLKEMYGAKYSPDPRPLIIVEGDIDGSKDEAL